MFKEQAILTCCCFTISNQSVLKEVCDKPAAAADPNENNGIDLQELTDDPYNRTSILAACRPTAMAPTSAGDCCPPWAARPGRPQILLSRSMMAFSVARAVFAKAPLLMHGLHTVDRENQGRKGGRQANSKM